MGRRRKADEEGRRLAATMRLAIGAEIRLARRSAGASQDAAAAEAGMSRAQYGRIERGEIAGISFVQASCAAAAQPANVSGRRSCP